MIAVVDETTPEIHGQIQYVVVCAVILADEDTARTALADVLPADRKRPFHWHDEGPVARNAMITAIDELDVLSRAKVVACGRRSQEAARAVALRSVVRTLLDDVCPHVIIESRSERLDTRDRHVILDVMREKGATGKLSYEWRGKGERLLWIADSVAGAVRAHLQDSPGAISYERLSESTALELEYLQLGARSSTNG